jgi:hypothetical protein
VSSLTPGELDRLVRSHRRLMLSAAAAVIAACALLVLLIPAGVPAPLGAGIGAGIGALVFLPHRRVLNDLGLSRMDARVILELEKERRSGVAALAPQVRADRDLLRSRIYLVLGVVMTAVLIFAASYAFSVGGKTVEEDAPLDPWFVTSIFSGIAALALAPTFFMLAWARKTSADSFRAMVADG